MTYQEKASKLRAQGCNCCQAVLGCCCDKWDMDEETARRLGAFFGGGMRRGEVCGAIVGAVMALGLQYGEDRKNTQSLALMKQFRETYGSILCKELLGEDGKKKKDLCPVLIQFCAEYLEREFTE